MASSSILTRSSLVVATTEHVSSNLAGEEVILDLASGTYYGLNEVGTAVWKLLVTPRRVADVCTHLQVEYDVAADALEHDVLALVNDMHRRHLVRLVA